MFKFLPKLKPNTISFLKKSNIWTPSAKNFKPFNFNKARFGSEQTSQDLTSANKHENGNQEKFN